MDAFPDHPNPQDLFLHTPLQRWLLVTAYYGYGDLLSPDLKQRRALGSWSLPALLRNSCGCWWAFRNTIDLPWSGYTGHQLMFFLNSHWPPPSFDLHPPRPETLSGPSACPAVTCAIHWLLAGTLRWPRQEQSKVPLNRPQMLLSQLFAKPSVCPPSTLMWRA